MLMATHIDIVQKLNVYPKIQSQDQKKLITLSNLDRQCPLLMYLVFFYNKTTTLDSDSAFSDLKLGLEETLSVWYPAAGRLGSDGGGCKLNLRCNSSGAVMVDAVATGVKLSELGDLGQYSEFYETLVYKPSFDGDFSAMPLVVAQVTRFACGGYSIGIGTSHSLFDGISAYEFLQAWAFNSHICSKSNGKITNKKDNLVIKPVHDRENLLFNRGVNRSPDSTRAAAIYHLYQLIKQAMMTHQGQDRNLELPDSSFVIKTFELNGEAIENMKKKSPQGFSYSSFEFLAAHLWKARIRALGFRRDAMVCLQFAVDIRKRMEPPLPEGFSGNAYVLASVASTAGELLEELTLETIVSKIREAKKSIDQDYINSYMEALGGGGEQRNDGNLPPIKELTLISDWSKMSFHSIGFGNSGKAADYVASLCPPVPQVAYFMKNPKDAKGVIVRIGLDPRDVRDFSDHFLG